MRIAYACLPRRGPVSPRLASCTTLHPTSQYLQILLAISQREPFRLPRHVRPQFTVESRVGCHLHVCSMHRQPKPPSIRVSSAANASASLHRDPVLAVRTYRQPAMLCSFCFRHIRNLSYRTHSTVHGNPTEWLSWGPWITVVFSSPCSCYSRRRMGAISHPAKGRAHDS